MDHGCQPPRTLQARHSWRMWFVFTVSVVCAVVGSRGASYRTYGAYKNDIGVTRERHADRARRSARESRSSSSELTRETYENARMVFEEFLNGGARSALARPRRRARTLALPWKHLHTLVGLLLVPLRCSQRWCELLRWRGKETCRT